MNSHTTAETNTYSTINRFIRSMAFALIAAVFIALPSATQAASTYTARSNASWQTGVNPNWSSTANWNGSVPTPVAGDVVNTGWASSSWNQGSGGTMNLDSGSITLKNLLLFADSNGQAVGTVTRSGSQTFIMDVGTVGGTALFYANILSGYGAFQNSVPVVMNSDLSIQSAVSHTSGFTFNSTATITGDSTARALTLDSGNNARPMIFSGAIDFKGTIAKTAGTGAITLGTATAAVGASGNITAISLNAGAASMSIGGLLTVASGGTTLTRANFSGNTTRLSITTGVSGTGDLILKNNHTVANGVQIITAGNVANAGQIRNEGGTGTGQVLINRPITSDVTDIIQNSATSKLVIRDTDAHSGDTTILAGTLQYDTIVHALGVVKNNGTLILNGDGDSVNQVLSSTGGDSAGNLTIGASATIGGNGSSSVINGIVSGDNTLIKSGGGTLTLGNSTANNTIGIIQVDAGELDLNASGGFYSIGGGYDNSLTINGGTAKFLANSQIRVGVVGNNSGVRMNSGTLNLNGTTQQAERWNLSGGTITGTGNLETGNGNSRAGEFNLAGVVVNVNLGEFSGGGVAYVNISGNVTLGGANYYTGWTSIDGAGGPFTLSISANNNLGAAGTLVKLNNEAVLKVTETVDLGAREIRMEGYGGVEVASTMTVTIGGGITDPNANGSIFTKTGDGKLILDSDSAVALVVSAGKLEANGTVSEYVTVGASGTLEGIGTVVGTLDLFGALSPGNSPGTLTAGYTTWEVGGSYIWELSQATGTQGVAPGWDFLSVTDALELGALTGGANTFTVYVTSLTLGNVAGEADSFDPNQSYTWTIASAVNLSNYIPGGIVLDLSGFENAYTGTWSIQAIDNDLKIHYEAPSSGPAGAVYKIK